MKNGRPANLLPLLTAIRHPIASNKVSYEKRYCNARKTKFCPWDTSGASNLVELQERLGGKIIRKTKVISTFIRSSTQCSLSGYRRIGGMSRSTSSD